MSISKILIVVVFVMVAAVPCFAQKETGAIRGTVSDTEGHPLPGATVTATSTSLVGGANVVTTNDKGFYWFPNLPPGTYEVKAEMNGFQTVARQDVRLFRGNHADAGYVNGANNIRGNPGVGRDPAGRCNDSGDVQDSTQRNGGESAEIVFCAGSIYTDARCGRYQLCCLWRGGVPGERVLVRRS